MDLFKEVLPAIDRGDINWVYNLTEKQLKDIAPYIAMKFMSAANNKATAEYHILAVNEIVNKNFWELQDYKDLQLILLTLCGTGKQQYHYFPGKSKTESKLFKFIRKIHPLWKQDEIEMYLDLCTADEIIQLARDSGMQDKDLKLFKKDVKKHYG